LIQRRRNCIYRLIIEKIVFKWLFSLKNVKKNCKLANFSLSGVSKLTKETMSKVQKSDQELVAEFKNGNKQVFDELIERHAAKMYQTAYGLLSNHHDAEEVVQDALVRAFRALDKFRGDSNLVTWLHRIVTNLARNKYHWNRRRGSEQNISLFQHSGNIGDEKKEEEIPLPDTTLGPQRVIEGKEFGKVLSDAFEKLPDSLRETMVLRHVQDMSYEKIAEILKCKVGTVKSRISRGREMLKDLLMKTGVL
jgi:RNA polymerase sigma-70 factor (ECF subfamily)